MDIIGAGIAWVENVVKLVTPDCLVVVFVVSGRGVFSVPRLSVHLLDAAH